MISGIVQASGPHHHILEAININSLIVCCLERQNHPRALRCTAQLLGNIILFAVRTPMHSISQVQKTVTSTFVIPNYEYF